MALRHTYFSANAFNPLPWLQRRLHPFLHHHAITLRGQTVHVRWTKRAQEGLDERSTPLYIEMQLYFSCVVQKRVLFHEPSPDPDYISVNDWLCVRATAVESDVCSPEAFAAEHPARRELESAAALKMVPRALWLDRVDGQWWGEMGFGHNAHPGAAR